MNEREAYIALNMMEKVGPVGVRAMVSALGSASAIFDVDAAVLQAVKGVGPECVRAVVAQRGRVAWAAEQENAADCGVRIITQVDAEYPGQLREIHDPPLALYVCGRFESRDVHAIAVIGTRHPTQYGLQCAERLASQLAATGFTVVSGLAEGIDTVAHRAALRAGGRTLAVTGSGLDCLYPESNRGLAREIAGQGAVMSEFPFGRKPDKTTFPIRNRIVSGLSRGVLVVEAGAKSGALITVAQALDQGRLVFAVPGRIDSAASSGPNRLIREGAKLVAGIDDVLAEFEFLVRPGTALQKAESRPVPRLSADEERLMGLLLDEEQCVDSLIRLSGLAPSAVNSLLIGLEMKRKIRMLPGRIVESVKQGDIDGM